MAQDLNVRGARPETANELVARMRLPLVVAPMFLVSTPALVRAACESGVIGALPALNARSSTILSDWLTVLNRVAANQRCVPYAVNLITHRSNKRFEADLSVLIAQRAPIVITSMGAPQRVVTSVHDYGGLVFSDVSSVAHARKAVAAGVDGLVLLCAGAGGNTGWLNPFAFVEAVRQFYSGLVIVAGGITSGRHLRALQAMGADLGYVGTAFIVANESAADDANRRALIECSADDVVQTCSVSGLPANVLRPSLQRVGIAGAEMTGELETADVERLHKPWMSEIWAAGHGVGAVLEIQPAAQIITRFEAEFASHAASGW